MWATTASETRLQSREPGSGLSLTTDVKGIISHIKTPIFKYYTD